MNEGPISQEFLSTMNSLARTLDITFNGTARGKDREVCFMLLSCKFNEQGRVNYISNGARKDCITMLKELLARFEGQPEQSGTA